MRPWLLRIAIVTSLLALALVLLVGWRTLRSEWDPLGPYPEQSVQASAGHVEWNGESYSGATISIPAVKAGDKVIVTGTKCSTESVNIQGTKAWVSRDHAGFTVNDGQSVVPRLEGCRTATYENRVPDELKVWIDDELGHHPFVVVVLGGCETPVRDDATGKVECWRSEPFAFVR